MKTNMRKYHNINEVLLQTKVHPYNENQIKEPNPILSTWSLNFNGGIPFVKGLAIINLVLMCSMATDFSLTRSLYG